MKQKVMIMRCADYDPQKIAGIISEGMQELHVIPSGKILVKPNVVIAHPEVFPHAFTRREFLDGVLDAVKKRSADMREIAVGERSGITVPTRFCFRNAGYPAVIKKHGVKAYYFDESRQVPVRLTGEHCLRDTIYLPKPVVNCDYLINLPKFKAHPWTGITLSLKNYIGLQDDRHRLVDHNSFLEHKIVDLQEVVQSRFIAVDAITAGQKMMLTPEPFDMGAVIMGVNPCAVDTVGCSIIGIDPSEIAHLRMASERGIGPAVLDDIEVTGDYPLDELREKARDFQICRERVDTYFDGDSQLRCTVGAFPEKHSADYCWGGCPGALQEAMHVFKGYYPDVLQTMKKVRYVVGKTDDKLDVDEDERVIFAGDCTAWKGEIGGEKVHIESRYKTTDKVDVHRTASNDMLLKIFSSLFYCFRKRNSRYIRAKGCPVSVAEHVNYLSSVGKIGNVNFDPRNLIQVNVAYWQMRFMRLVNRLFG